MPNRIHLLWNMEEPHKRVDVQRDILKYTAQQIKFDLLKRLPAVLKKFRVEAKIRQYQPWERNPLSVYRYSNALTEQKQDYIHNNPVQEKRQLAALPEEFHNSSARYYFDNVDEFRFLAHYRD